MFVKIAWYWLCICFLFYNIFDLIESRRKVFYEFGIGNLKNEVHISVCLKIDSKRYSCSNLDEVTRLICERIKKYFEFIESESKKSPKEILEKSNDLPALFKLENSSEKFKFLNLGNLCTLYKLQLNLALEVKNEWFTSNRVKFENIYNVSLKIFLHGERINRYQRYELLECSNFRSCHYFTLTMRLVEKEVLPYPYKTDCINYSSEKFYFQRFENISSKSDCIQECIKYKQRLPQFFYTKNDIDPLDFKTGRNYDHLDLNRLEYCRTICLKPSCKGSYFNLESIKYDGNQTYIEFKIFVQTAPLKTIPSMGSFKYWRMSFGYISLIFRVSILSLVLKSYKLLPKLEKKLAISIASIFLWIGFLACLLWIYNLGQIIYDDFTKKSCFTYAILDLPFSPFNFSLAICKTVNHSVQKHKDPLFELLKPGVIFKNSEKFMIEFLNETKELDISNKRFFYKSINQQDSELCFSIDVSVEEHRYRSLLSSTSLVKETKWLENEKIYLHEYNKSFTTTSFELKKNIEIKLMEGHNTINCKNYTLESDGLCNSKQHCIDKCVNEKFVKIFDKLPLKSLVYLDDYEDYQQKYLYFDFENTENDTFHNECEKKFNEMDCDSVHFEGDEFVEFSTKKNDHLRISLFPNRITHGSNLKFSLIQMIFVFFDLSTIVTGLNWPKISRFLVYSLNYICRLKPDESFNFR